MLELDYLHRAEIPIEPRLRGMMRWTAAHANRCAYSEAYAVADLRRAGLDEVADTPNDLSRSQRSPLNVVDVFLNSPLSARAGRM